MEQARPIRPTGLHPRAIHAGIGLALYKIRVNKVVDSFYVSNIT